MKVAINGFCGQMGQALYQKLLQDDEIKFAGGVDKINTINAKRTKDYEVAQIFSDLNCIEDCDGVIDFSHYSSLSSVLDFCIKRKIPLVIATTGHNLIQQKQIEFASKFIPICKSGNFSFGVQTLLKLVSICAHLMPNADVEIVETHHNKKLDAPSGTAKMIFEEIAKQRPNSVVCVNKNRTSIKSHNEIGISSLRGGNIVGEHKCIFFDKNECITITHNAYSRDIFATGAIKAIKFLQTKTNGLYNMQDLLENFIK